MKPHIIAISLVALTASSCDKARNLVSKAQSAVSSEIAKQAGDSGSGSVDEELQKLVDQTPAGVVFRKDLPFPARLEVRVIRNDEVSLRSTEVSAIERTMTQVKGTNTETAKFERVGNQIRYTELETSFIELGTDVETRDSIHESAKAAKPIVFIRTGTAWNSDGRDFHSAALSKTLSPVFDQILVDNAVAPRTLWLGKNRIKIGDQLAVKGANLGMLVAGKATGSLAITLEALEPVNGHPCGVFAISGEYSRKQFPDMNGDLTDGEISIQSGKIWLSLIYPVILREELQTIQTISSGGRGNLSRNGRGTVNASVVRQWKAL
jgi:hypothetical protein